MIIFLLLFSQYFGQNKIQYRDFDFSILKSEHFQIYFYPGEEPLADFAKVTLEQAYEEYVDLLKTKIDFKIPVIIYASPNEFAQTNVTLELIEESVGGFTEIFKNRIVVPFSGSYKEFHHVLRHELVHVFQFQIFLKSSISSILTTRILQTIPLWIIEGMAEYLSVGWNTEADIYLKDLLLSGKLIPL
ncbi:MAG TPA: biopolymer transporter Tol, partial [bacterium (Candidatus Stahlbacteria)]|nr:biopolymer transporter Tol [Candidatus Stahlbacteria bacterium]